MAPGLVFVTVGTTEFDRLIEAVVQKSSLRILKEKGYFQLILQIGNGKYKPEHNSYDGINVDYYRFKDSLKEDIINAELIISHAGAGSCMEILEARKPAVIVVNDALMHNHQNELATVLAERNHVFTCTPKTLLQTLQSIDLTKLQPFPSADECIFPEFLDEVMGVGVHDQSVKIKTSK